MMALEANGSSSTQMRVLDVAALRVLVTQPNSSKYAVDAHNRSIEEIGDLSELPKLCSLDLSFNRIQALKNLQTASELREIKLYNNKLTSGAGLKANSNLEILMLNENRIEDIPADLLALGKLKTLWLNGNCIQRVQNLRSSRQLVHLDLSRNRLTGSVPEGLESLVNLEYLNLSGNQLSSVGNMLHLVKLEELALSNNSLRSLDGLYPPGLTVLRVNGNQLPSLDSLPVGMTSLNELYAQDNAISDLTALSTRCPELESLDIRTNRLEASSDVATALTQCPSIRDLWMEGNPCCFSSSYVLDLFTALPELKTVDTLTDSALQAHAVGLKNGTIASQRPLSSRPLTPSSRTFRPGSASSSRPGSSSSHNRPITPTGRPSTPDTAPVFHQPSSRIGMLQKLMPSSEVEQAQAQVLERLQSIKDMLRRMGNQDTGLEQEPQRQGSKRLGNRRQEMNAVTSNQRRTAVRTADAMPETETVAHELVKPPSTKPRKLCVDTGTDPLETLMGNNNSALPPPPPVPTTLSAPRSKGHEMETQTIEFQSESPEEEQPESALEPDKPSPVPQDNGALIELEMKQFLAMFASNQAPDEQDLTREYQPQDLDDQSTTESPRLDAIKTSEQRKPPSAQSRQGYRSFRLPTARSRPNTPVMNTA